MGKGDRRPIGRESLLSLAPDFVFGAPTSIGVAAIPSTIRTAAVAQRDDRGGTHS